MDDDQISILAELLQSAAALAEPGWREMIIKFYLEEHRSGQGNTYLLGDPPEELPLPFDPNLDPLMRRLRDHLVQGGRPPFTHCTIHMASDGAYETSYGYDPVDWPALMDADWNFFPKKTPAPTA